MSAGRVAFAFIAAILVSASAATAQTRRGIPLDEERLPGRIEISFGAVWMGSNPYGSLNATESTPAGGRFVLFSTSTNLAAAAGAEARVGVRFARVLQIEADSSYSRPELRTSVSADAENASPFTAAESLMQFTVGGALVAHLTRWHLGAHGVPFVIAGGGYLRQLHETETLAANGQTYFVGGGAKYAFRASPNRRLKGLGIRADVRVAARRRGVALDGGTHVSPAAAGSLFVRF